MERPKLGIIGVVHEEAKRDYWGTMSRLAEIGYEGVEGAGALLEGDAKANVKRFHELGLRVATHSASRDDLRDNLERVISQAHTLETNHITVWWAPCDSREAVLRDAELYNEAGAKIAAEGLKLCYHNHAHEFTNAWGGVNALYILAEHTDPSWVHFRLDVAWITLGGADPAHIIRKMAGRVPAIHLKDVYDTETHDHWTAVGTGIVRIADSIQAARDIGGVEWMTVEQDRLRNLSPLDTAIVSYLNLKEAGLV